VDSRAQSLELFRSGKSVDQIARERMMAVSTIEEHLAYYIGLGVIQINELVTPEVMELIANQVDDSAGHQTLSPVKAALGDRVTWGEIRYVMKHLEYLKNTVP
jgi:ATP-dependent DNA helicase RecQ